MADIILAIHVLLALGLIVFILLQKSDGGALGGLKSASPSSKVFGKELEDPMAKEMWKDFGAPTPQEIVAAEQRLIKFKNVT